jgi:peptide/nickel transport system substrate-binding protein/oligopeptide transport system substrate-binding protein
VALVALLALALGLAACGSSSDGGGASPASSGAPVKGGTLTVTYQGEPTELDPAIAWELTSWGIERLTYQTFLTYASEPGEPGTQLVPDLATEVPSAENGGISADGKTYTFHLKQGVKFAPPVNREVTAQDFKYSFERMMVEPLAPATYFYEGIVGATEFMAGKAKEITGYRVVDDYTVEITLKQAEGSFLMAMTMPFTSVMPKEWVKKVGKDIKRKPLGTGPYVITDWTNGQSITAEKNPNWTGDSSQWVDGMKFLFTSNPSTALLQLERGEVDVLGDGIPAADYNRTKNDPNWSKYTLDASEIATYYVFMNVNEKPFTDVKVRQAVNYAIDTQRIQKLLAGQAEALNQIYPNGMPGYQPDAQFYSYDLEKAKQLLSEAGFPDGFKVTFVAHNVEPFPKLAQAVQNDLRAIGIDASIKLMDKATYWDYISLPQSHAAIGLTDWYMDFPDPSDFIGPLYTHPIEGGANANFYTNPEVEALYKASNTELDPAKRIEMFVQMQDIIMGDAPSAILYQPLFNGMFGKDVGGFYYHQVWNLQFQEMWKLDGK